jgi:hypothetical protein
MSETITLGGRRFEIRPLKLGQLRHLLDALEEISGKMGGAVIESAAKIVAVGLGPAYPDLTAEAILDLEATVDELNTAVAAILLLAGLRPGQPGQPGLAPGEAPPVASPGPFRESSSAPFTAPSPPAAAMPIRSSTA